MADNRNSTEPPVPPRRTKRRVKIAPIEPLVASRAATEITNDVAKSQQKRPPLPPLPEKCRRNNSRYLENRQPQCDTAVTCPRVKSERHYSESRNCVAETASKMTEAKSHDDTTSARDNSPTSNSANDDPIPESIVPRPPFLSSVDVALSKRKAFDKYPSLFFTLHDFENVVSTNTWNRNDTEIHSKNLHEQESSRAHTLDDDNICFRVTTTNLPFEKCLDRWRDPFNDGDFIPKFDNCRFENSTNENHRIDDKRSSGHDVFENNDDSKCRIGTKVRFMIESSNTSPSKRDPNVKISVPCDSSRSYKSILGDEQAGEQSAVSSVKLTEIREEFADIKDCCDNTRDKSYTSRVEKGNSAMTEDDLPAGANKVDTKLNTIPQTYCDDKNNDGNWKKIREKDSDLILSNVQAKDENLKTGEENIIRVVRKKTITSKEYDTKRMDQSNTLEVVENVRGFTDKSLETACGIEEATKITQKIIHREEKMFLKKSSDDIKEKCVAKNEKVFFDESSQTFFNKCNNDESNKNISTDDFINKSVQIEQTRRLPEENKERNNSFVDSKNNHEIVSPSEDIFVKNIPVKVRRNSFLETMLSDDLTDISMNCSVISASTSINKELSDPNKLLNKIRELETDITIETEHLRDFCNTTEIDAKDEKVLKNSEKMEEKIVNITNGKLTQSKNKNASDVKNDVLNELLCNFNNIKLKIVSPENKKSMTNIKDDENISYAIAINNRISKGKENASKFENSRNTVCSNPLNTKAIYSDDTIVEEIIKEDPKKTKIEERLPEFKKNIPAISEKIAKNKNIEIKKPNKSSLDIKNKIVKDYSEMKISKNSPDIKSKDVDIKMRSEKISEETKSVVQLNREPKKSQDIRIPKTILKKTNVECERQQANEFQKRIPIGAPATMNKIFDSREFKAIVNTTRKDSLENGRKCEKASREIHTRGKEKTDEVIADDEADDDRKRIANRSALALVEDTMSRGDKCAIARKTISVNPCNNNDNNRAVTPVANISNDQSFRDVVTITPGKVRSFVKYYEIWSDTTIVERHSKINDREKVARRKFTKSQAVPIAMKNSQRPEVITKETKDGDRSVKSNDCNLSKTLSNKTQPFAPKVPEEPLNNLVCKTEMESKMEYEKSGSHMSDKEIRASFIKTDAKKSVQFLGGCTVINSETFGKDKSAGTVASRDTNMLRKRKAPGVPPSRDCDDYQKLVREIAKSEKPPNVGKDPLRPQKAVTQVSKPKF